MVIQKGPVFKQCQVRAIESFSRIFQRNGESTKKIEPCLKFPIRKFKKFHK
jgi:hypothetical protein